MAQHLTGLFHPDPAHTAAIWTEAAQDLAAAQMLFCERLFGAQAVLAANWGPHARHPDFNERPSVSARRPDWVND